MFLSFGPLASPPLAADQKTQSTSNQPQASAKNVSSETPSKSKASPDSNEEAAQKLKLEGNAFLKAGKVAEGIEVYTKAIALDPNCAVFYANRFVLLLSKDCC